MKLNETLQQLHNKLDKARRTLAAAQERKDQVIITRFEKEIEALVKQIDSAKRTQARQISQRAEEIKAMPFHRELTKTEQADMGALKKSVRGLVVVHPLTSLGKELGLSQVTGYAPKAF